MRSNAILRRRRVCRTCYYDLRAIVSGIVGVVCLKVVVYCAAGRYRNHAAQCVVGVGNRLGSVSCTAEHEQCNTTCTSTNRDHHRKPLLAPIQISTLSSIVGRRSLRTIRNCIRFGEMTKAPFRRRPWLICIASSLTELPGVSRWGASNSLRQFSRCLAAAASMAPRGSKGPQSTRYTHPIYSSCGLTHNHCNYCRKH